MEILTASLLVSCAALIIAVAWQSTLIRAHQKDKSGWLERLERAERKLADADSRAARSYLKRMESDNWKGFPMRVRRSALEQAGEIYKAHPYPLPDFASLVDDIESRLMKGHAEAEPN